jgi:nucleoside-diphosphate-sugar epimerase
MGSAVTSTPSDRQYRSPDAVVVIGATSLVGRYLLPRLAASGRAVHAIGRHDPGEMAPHVQWHRLDVVRAPEALPPAPAVVHLAPLWLAPPLVEILAAKGMRRLIAFGSTSRVTKEASADAGERDIARRLAEAEDALLAAGTRRGVAVTVFRPTLIYGGGRDRSLAAIARWARRLGFVLIAGEGRGLRQPVHADDLAAACVMALDAPVTHGQVYDLGGGTAVSYRAMAEEVCRAAGGRRVIGVPPALLRAAFRAISLLPGQGQVTTSMVDRMGRDLIVDHTKAARDFGYAPRAFAYPDGPPATR